MNRRLIFLCAFLVASAASYIVYRLIGRQIKTTAKKETAQILVATRDLEIGALIKPGDVRFGELVGRAPNDVVVKAEGAVGRGVVSPIFAGEPIHEKRLARVGSGAGLASTIPAGMRACAVKVNEVVGVAGFAVAGMRVDVLIAGNAPMGMNPIGTKVRTLLQNIEVLSAGKNFQRDAEGKPEEEAVVNLLVTPAQAELLSLASSNETRIQLILRNPSDREITSPPGSELGSLFGAPAPAVIKVASERRPPVAPAIPISTEPQITKAAAKPEFVIEVLNGPKHTEQVFAARGGRE